MSRNDQTDKPSGKPAGTPNATMPPRCDEYSGGGGSFPDTRDRAMPGHKEGDCSRIGNAPDEEKR